MDRSGYATFTISHYNGPVTYSSEAFLERDADVINPDFVQLLRRSPGVESNARRVPTATLDGGGSTNEFIQQLFESRAVSTEHHPQDNDTIVAAQQPVKPRRAPSTRRKGGRPTRLPSVGEEREDQDDRDEVAAVGGGNDQAPVRGVRCVLGEFRGAMDLLYGALSECQPWFIFCLNPNDAHLPNQVETRGLRASIKSLGFVEIARKLATSFEVSLTHAEACERYADELNAYGIPHGGVSPAVDAIRSLAAAKHWQEGDMAIGQHKVSTAASRIATLLTPFQVFLSHRAFHALEDRLRLYEDDTQTGKQRNLADLQAEEVKEDPFSPYRQSTLIMNYQGPFADNDYNNSRADLPLASKAAREYEELPPDAEDDFADHKTLNYDDRYTSRYGDTMSYAGTEAYAPSKNMFDTADNKAYLNEKDPDKEPLDGEIAEEYRISSARKRWMILVTMLTFLAPHWLLKRIPRFRRDDIRQAWKEKLAINLIIWFICGCAVFVIAILGNLICPTEHVYSTGELAAHNYDDDPSNAYVSIRGEVSHKLHR
jgi:chitin synthase